MASSFSSNLSENIRNHISTYLISSNKCPSLINVLSFFCGDNGTETGFRPPKFGHSERSKLYRVLAILSAKGFMPKFCFQNVILKDFDYHALGYITEEIAAEPEINRLSDNHFKIFLLSLYKITCCVISIRTVSVRQF